jgi:hypothetical protein
MTSHDPVARTAPNIAVELTGKKLALFPRCAAVDGTAKKEYPNINSVGKRFRKFIQEYIDIIELMFGGIDLVETVFPFTDNKGHIGMKFEDIIYENFRCHLAHGDELKIGFGVSLKISESVDTFMVDIVNQSMTIPESTIYALGLPCVLSIVNGDQLIGDDSYYYNDLQNKYNIDSFSSGDSQGRAALVECCKIEN